MATLVKYPDPNPESSSVDGYVYKADDSSWSTTRSEPDAQGFSDTGGAALSAVGRTAGGNYIIYRGINVLDTSTLDDTGTPSISAAVWSVTSSGNYEQCQETSHTCSNFDHVVMISCDTLESPDDTAIAVGDYNASLTDLANPIEVSDRIENSVSGAKNFTFSDPTGLASIAVNGKTRFMAREGHDVDDATFVHSGGGSSEFEGDGHRNAEMETEGLRPYLTVTYTISTSDIQAVNGIALASIQTVNGITAANGEAINGVDF